MKKHDLHTYVGWGLTAFLVIACSLIFYFCFDRILGLRSFIGSVLNMIMPIIWGIVIAYLLSPVYNYLHRNLHPLFQRVATEKRALLLSGGVSIFLSILLAILVIYALFAMIVPQLISSIGNIINGIPTYVSEVRSWLRNTLENYPELQSDALSIYNNLSNKAMDWVESHLSADSIQDMLPSLGSFLVSVTSGVKKVVSGFANFFIGFIVAVYLLAAKKMMCGQLKRVIYAIFPKKVGNIILEQCRYAHKSMSGFISGKILDSVVVGILCFVGCSILQIPYALLVSVIMCITNLIPFFGPVIGAVPCALFILLNSPWKCVIFVIFIVVVMQVDGNIIEPKIIGDSTGLSAFWVVFALLLFGGLFGVPGMILGVPIFAVLYHMVDEGTKALLRKRKMSTKTKDYVLLERVDGESYVKLQDPAFKPDYSPENNLVDQKKRQGQSDSSNHTKNG